MLKLTLFQMLFSNCCNVIFSSSRVIHTKKLLQFSKSVKISEFKRLCGGSDKNTTAGENTADTMDLKKVVNVLQNFAPTSYAGSWDNVGLLIEPLDNKTINKILVTNDLTEPVMEEAITEAADMIISYHPPIFRPLKRLTSKNWKERVVLRCVQHNIALYSPHTSWDAVQNGINEWLLQPFGKLIDVEPCEQVYSSSPAQYTLTLPDGGTQVVSHQDLVAIISDMSADEQGKLSIVKQEARPLPGIGPGRIAKLQTKLSLSEAISRVKTHLNLAHLRFALANGASLEGDSVGSVGVCAGSGGSVLASKSPDLILTGEMSHHEVLDFVHRGVSVILTDHSNTERGFHSHVRDKLVGLMENKVDILVSKVDRDPLVIM